MWTWLSWTWMNAALSFVTLAAILANYYLVTRRVDSLQDSVKSGIQIDTSLISTLDAQQRQIDALAQRIDCCPLALPPGRQRGSKDT